LSTLTRTTASSRHGRAAGLVLAPGFLQLHAAADHLDDVGPGDEFVDEMLGDAGHGLIGVRYEVR